MRQSAARRLRRGQWLQVEAGLFDLRNLGSVECVEVLADGRDHVLVQRRGERLAIPKRRGYIGAGFEPRRLDGAITEESTLPADVPTGGTPHGGESG